MVYVVYLVACCVICNHHCCTAGCHCACALHCVSDMPCAIHLQESGAWHRGLVEEELGDGQVHVRLVDYGHLVEVTREQYVFSLCSVQWSL